MVTRTEIRELDLRARLTGIDEAIDTLNRLAAAEEGVVITSEKMVRSDASVARSVNALQGRYVEHHRLLQQTTRDMNLLHEAHARGIIGVNQYQAALAGMQAKLLAVSDAGAKAVTALRGWDGMAAPSTGSYAAMQTVMRAADEKVKAAQRAEQMLRSLGGAPEASPARPAPVTAPAGPRRLRADQAINFGYQAGDTIGSLGAGASWGTVAFQQGPQIIGIAAETGMTAREIVTDLGKRAMGLVTPLRLLAGGVTAVGIAAVMAYSDWLDQQMKLEASLAGIGRRTGLVARELNDLAVANASAGGVSNAVAREIAGTYASTGKIGAGVMGSLIAATRDYAATTGQEVPAAAQELARAFADPAKGAELLNGKLGTLSAKAQGTIEALLRARDTEGAQKALYDTMVQGLDSARDRMTLFGRAWDDVKTAISNGWTGLFEAPKLEKEIAAIERRIKTLQEETSKRKNALEQVTAALAGEMGPRDAGVELEQDRAKLAELNKQLEEARARKAALDANALSLDAVAVSKRFVPDRGEYLDLIEQQTTLQKALADTAVRAKMSADQISQVERALAGVSAAVENYLSPLERAAQAHNLDLRAITARTTAQKAAVEADRARAAALQDATKAQDADRYAAMAAAKVYADAAEESRRYAESRTLGLNQSIQSRLQDISLVGAGASEIETARWKLEQYQEIEREALNRGAEWARKQKDEVDRLAGSWGELGQRAAQARLLNDLQFEGAQAGRSDREQEVYSRMRSAGLLNRDGRIEGETNTLIAMQIRHQQAVKETAESYRDLGENIADALQRGEKPMKALGNALMRQIGREATKSVGDSFAMLARGVSGKGPMDGKTIGAGDLVGLHANAVAGPIINVPAMTVTAATVMLGGPGLAALAANANVPNLGLTGGVPQAGMSGAPVPVFAMTGDMNERARQAMSYFKSQGWSDEQAAGIVGNLAHESKLRTTALNPNDGGPGAHSVGIAQWNRDRLDRLKAFGGANWQDYNTQLAFVQHELNTTESAAATRLRGATDVHSATAAFASYERPQGWTAGNPYASHGFDSRLTKANAMLSYAPLPANDATALPPIAVTAQATAAAKSVEKLGSSAQSATGNIGGFGDKLGGLTGEMGSMAAGLGGLLGMLAGGKKNGAVGGAIGMLAGKFLAGGMADGGWMSKLLGGGAAGAGGGLGSLFGFEHGGVMTSRGPLPLRAYSRGGVANSPQLAMFGEGSVPEAYVPVPSGRIPVEMNMPMPQVIVPPAAPRDRPNVSIGGSTFNVNGSMDDKTMAGLRREMAAERKALLEALNNQWRDGVAA